MTKEVSNRYAKLFLHYEKNFARLYRTYYMRLRYAIGPAKANKFVQLETNIQRAFAYEIQARIPFIDEMKTFFNFLWRRLLK